MYVQRLVLATSEGGIQGMQLRGKGRNKGERESLDLKKGGRSTVMRTNVGSARPTIRIFHPVPTLN
jgi:hypothetical protein